MLDKFLSHFPPPKYIDVPYTGIAFSDDCVRLLNLEGKNKHPVSSLELNLEPGVIEMGKVMEFDKLSRLLSDQSRSLPSPFVKFCFPDEASYVFNAKVPVTAGHDAKESINFILEENIPLPISDISFDFSIQKVMGRDGGYSAEVAVIAASTSIIDSYTGALESAGLEPLSCVSESQAIACSIVARGSSLVQSIVQVRKRSVGIYIANGEQIEFSSVIPITPDSPAESVKSIKSELERALDYWSARRNGNVEHPVIPCNLCGDWEVLKVLESGLGQIKMIKTQLADVWVNLFSVADYLPEIKFEDSLQFAAAAGLFLNR